RRRGAPRWTPPRNRAARSSRRFPLPMPGYQRSRAARREPVACESGPDHVRAFVPSWLRQMPLVRELLQKSQVVLVEQPDVFHLIPQDRDALDADAPGEAGVLFRVVPDCLEDGGVHHAAAAHFDPPRALAHRAAGAVTLPAAQVDLGA